MISSRPGGAATAARTAMCAQFTVYMKLKGIDAEKAIAGTDAVDKS